MKLTLSFKTPDVLETIRDDIRMHHEQRIWHDHNIELDDLTPEEREEFDYIVESDYERIREQLGRWIQYGEAVQIEFDINKDSDSDTARVIERA